MKTKRMTKTEKDQRRKVLQEYLLDKWVVMEDVYHHGYFFVKHLLAKGEGSARVEQVIISFNPEVDGIYEVADYSFDFEQDESLGERILVFQLKKYDLKFGMDSEKHCADTYRSLLVELLKGGYVTNEELHQMENRPHQFAADLRKIKMQVTPHRRNKGSIAKEGQA